MAWSSAHIARYFPLNFQIYAAHGWVWRSCWDGNIWTATHRKKGRWGGSRFFLHGGSGAGARRNAWRSEVQGRHRELNSGHCIMDPLGAKY